MDCNARKVRRSSIKYLFHDVYNIFVAHILTEKIDKFVKSIMYSNLVSGFWKYEKIAPVCSILRSHSCGG